MLTKYERLVGGVVKYIAVDEVSLGFDSRAGQFGRSRQRIGTAAMFLQSCFDQALSPRGESITRSMLRRNTASIMKI